MEQEKLAEKEPAGSALWVAYGNILLAIINLAVVIFQQFTAINVVLYYSVEIFISQGPLLAKLGSSLIGVGSVIMAIATIFVVDSINLS